MPAPLCFWACTWLKRRLGYDDLLDVFGVHGVGGVTGTLLVGVFAVGAISASPEMPAGFPGLLEGNPRQVLIQLYGVVATLVWSGVMTFVVLKVIELMVPLRVSAAERDRGPRRHPARRGAAVAERQRCEAPDIRSSSRTAPVVFHSLRWRLIGAVHTQYP